jgi:hypothetical protein
MRFMARHSLETSWIAFYRRKLIQLVIDLKESALILIKNWRRSVAGSQNNANTTVIWPAFPPASHFFYFCFSVVQAESA